MTDQQIEYQIKAIKETSKELLKNKETARQFLRDAGIPVVGLIKSAKKKK